MPKIKNPSILEAEVGGEPQLRPPGHIVSSGEMAKAEQNTFASWRPKARGHTCAT